MAFIGIIPVNKQILIISLISALLRVQSPHIFACCLLHASTLVHIVVHPLKYAKHV